MSIKNIKVALTLNLQVVALANSDNVRIYSPRQQCVVEVPDECLALLSEREKTGLALYLRDLLSGPEQKEVEVFG